MFLSESLDINSLNHLTIGDADTIEIAEKFGTPAYVMDETLIRKNCRLYIDSIKRCCGKNGLALYASKAFSCVYMLKIIADEGMGLDVVSGAELYTAHKANFPMERIYFHGNNKTPAELKMALEYGVGRFVVDNKYELERLNELSEKSNKISNVLFRIKPGVDAHTHDFISTGQIDSKFGFAIETGEAMEILSIAKSYKNINIVGLHSHIGSQIFDCTPFVHTAEIMVNFMADIKNELGIEFDELNLGGGMGIRYIESDNPINYDEYIEDIADKVKELTELHSLKMPKILMEPGRSIVGSAGITLYTVGCIKDIPNVRKYISVDGGISDNPRYIMYDAKYEAIVANRADSKKEQIATIAGKCCESGDLLIKDAFLPNIKVGDTLAIMSTGAYNYSMSSNYNRLPKPPVIMVTEGNPHIIVKRETYDDVLKNDLY